MVLIVTRSSRPRPFLPLASRRGSSVSWDVTLHRRTLWVPHHLGSFWVSVRTGFGPFSFCGFSGSRLQQCLSETSFHSTAQPPGMMTSPQIHHVREWTPPGNLFLRGGVLSSISLAAPGRYLSDTLRSAREVLRLLLVAVLLTAVKRKHPEAL